MSVERLLLQVWEPANAKARDERAELEAVARDEGLNEAIEPWDWRYYAEKVRKARYDLDEADIKPYFVLDNLVQAAFDPARYDREFLDRMDVPKEIGLRHRLPHFQHLFAGGGYAAGYYAYLWAEVLDADGFAAFTEAGNAFDPELAARLKAIYSAADTRDPMELYLAFRGRKLAIAALLQQRGLAAGQSG